MADLVAPTGSPFRIRVHGAWVLLEGVTPGVGVDSDRPRSEFRSLDGNRYTQRARLARRAWTLSVPYAASAGVAAVRAAIQAETDVYFASDEVLSTNMLPERSGYGVTLPTINCGGLMLPTLAPSQVVTGYVRGGVATTLSCWTTASSGTTVLTVVRPGGTTNVVASAGGRASATFTPSADGPVTITASAGAARSSGLMLAETAVLPTVFVQGEGGGMPCKVDVQDPDDTMTMRHGGYWRHDYSVVVREVD